MENAVEKEPRRPIIIDDYLDPIVLLFPLCHS